MVKRTIKNVENCYINVIYFVKQSSIQVLHNIITGVPKTYTSILYKSYITRMVVYVGIQIIIYINIRNRHPLWNRKVFI